MKNADMPAMPISEEETDRLNLEVEIYTGFTKREMMAMHMMASMMSVEWFETAERQARVAIKAADALLAELERTGGAA